VTSTHQNNIKTLKILIWKKNKNISNFLKLKNKHTQFVNPYNQKEVFLKIKLHSDWNGQFIPNFFIT